MNNQETISAAVNQWAGQIIEGILPQVSLPQSKTTSFISNLFGIDLSNYSLLNEFSFLIPDLLEVPVKTYIRSTVEKMGIKDEDLPEYFRKIVTSCIKRIDQTGEPINIYGFEFEKKSFEKLLSIYKEMKQK